MSGNILFVPEYATNQDEIIRTFGRTINQLIRAFNDCECGAGGSSLVIGGLTPSAPPSGTPVFSGGVP